MKKPIAGGPATILASGQALPTSIAVDSTSVYWLNNSGNGLHGLNRNAVVKVPIEGGNPTVLAPTNGNPGMVRVDHESVYWSDDSGISKVPLGGGAPVLLVPGQYANAVPFAVGAQDLYFGSVFKAPLTGLPGGGAPAVVASGGGVLALAVDNTSVYMLTNQSVLKAPLDGVPDGGTPTTLASYPAATGLTSLLLGNLSGIALLTIDAENVYWTALTNYNASNPSFTGSIMKAPLAGLPDGGLATTLASGLPSPVNIAVSPTAVFWTDVDVGIEQVPLDGVANGGAPTVFNLDFAPTALASNPAGVIVAGRSSIAQLPADGSPPVILATGQAGCTAVTTDDTNVYWTTNGSTANKQQADGYVMTAPLTSGAPVRLAGPTSNATGIAVNSNSIFWTTKSANPFLTTPNLNLAEELLTVGLGGGTAQMLAGGSGLESYTNIAVDSTSVYWTASGNGNPVPPLSPRVLKMPLEGVPDGGAPVLIATAQQSPTALAVDETGIYWTLTNTSELLKAPLDGVPDGGAPTVLSSWRGYAASGVAVDGAIVYWAFNDGQIGGYIATVPREGSAAIKPAILAVQIDTIDKLAVDSNSLYFITTSGALMKITPKPR
jgi:hypothetical protein